MRLAHCLTAAVVAVAILAASARAAAPTACSTVPAGGITVTNGEAQHWWETGTIGAPELRPDGAFWPDMLYDPAEAHGHVHVNAPMPFCQTVGSRVGRSSDTFTVTVKQHEGAALDTINDVKAKVYSGSAAHQTNIGLTDFVNQTCPDFDMHGHRDCTSTFALTVDWTKVPDDGWQAFRIRAYGSDTNGYDREAILWAPVYVDNRTTVDTSYCASVAKCAKGTGWYADSGYLNVSLTSPWPVAPLVSPSAFGVRYWATTENCSDGTTCADEPTHLFASVDPAFHAEPPNEGLVLLDEDCAGQTGCNTTGGVNRTVTVDPGVLCNGPHKLFLRGDGNSDLPTGRRNTGAYVVPFTTNVAGQPAC